MTGGRRFSPRSPDWGQDHLSLDAVVAYVDDELTAGPHTRAEAHLAGCAECRAEVVVQRQARTALRAAAGPCLPSSLLRSLRSIPVEAELPPPPPDLGITADGQFVLLRDLPRAAPASHPDGPPVEAHGGVRWLSRRARFGAVSGLAIGALAVGALAVPGPTSPSAQGVLGGRVLGVPVQAGLSASQVVPAAGPAGSPALRPAVVARPGPAVANPAVANPAVANPAAVDAPSGDSTAGDASGPATDAVDATTSSSATAPEDSSAVLDARLRAQLDRSPVAFYRSP